MPTAHGGDDFVGIGGPGEGLGLLIVLVEKAVDGCLQVGDGPEYAALEASFGQGGEKPFDGVEPRGGCRREVEGPAGMAVEPLAHLGMFVRGVIVDDGVDRLSCRDLAFDGAEEADELLVSMALHVAADHRAVEDIHSGEQRRRAMPDVVVRHGSGPALLERQTRLGAIEGLDLALFIERQDDGVLGRIDIEPDHVAQFLREFGIIGKLELARPVRPETMGTPYPMNGTDAQTSSFGHERAGPMASLPRGIAKRQRHDALGRFNRKRRDARAPGLVAKKALKPLLHEAFLPAPHASLRLAGPAHDLIRAGAVAGQQNDFGPPNVLLRGVAVLDESHKRAPITWRYENGFSCAHRADSHSTITSGIPD